MPCWLRPARARRSGRYPGVPRSLNSSWASTRLFGSADDLRCSRSASDLLQIGDRVRVLPVRMRHCRPSGGVVEDAIRCRARLSQLGPGFRLGLILRGRRRAARDHLRRRGFTPGAGSQGTGRCCLLRLGITEAEFSGFCRAERLDPALLRSRYSGRLTRSIGSIRRRRRPLRRRGCGHELGLVAADTPDP